MIVPTNMAKEAEENYETYYVVNEALNAIALGLPAMLKIATTPFI